MFPKFVETAYRLFSGSDFPVNLYYSLESVEGY